MLYDRHLLASRAAKRDVPHQNRCVLNHMRVHFILWGYMNEVDKNWVADHSTCQSGPLQPDSLLKPLKCAFLHTFLTSVYSSQVALLVS